MTANFISRTEDLFFDRKDFVRIVSVLASLLEPHERSRDFGAE
jgi:hypothetical protein